MAKAAGLPALPACPVFARINGGGEPLRSPCREDLEMPLVLPRSGIDGCRLPGPSTMTGVTARRGVPRNQISDRKSTRLNPVTTAHLVCRLLLEKKKKQ